MFVFVASQTLAEEVLGVLAKDTIGEVLAESHLRRVNGEISMV